MKVIIDDLAGPEVANLLAEHLQEMHGHSPPESIHALNLEQLRQSDITIWSAWDGSQLMGCGALKELDSYHGEIKSMRTARNYLRQGVAKEILRIILAEAVTRNYKRLSLETGSMDVFEPARRLYASFGFEFCAPFGDYIEDPYSVFMTKIL